MVEIYRGYKYEILCILDFGADCHAPNVLMLKELPCTCCLGGWMLSQIYLDFIRRGVCFCTINWMWSAQPVVDHCPDSSVLSYLTMFS